MPRNRYLVQASWNDVPHLDAATKAQLLASIPPYQKEARSQGIPSLGSGLIYKVAQSDVVVPDLATIPKHWPRAFGLDFGWNWTAAVWGAWNRESDVVYLYSAYKRGEAEPAIHAEAMKARGLWIPGVCDPAGRGSSVIDGKKAVDVYKRLGLTLSLAENAVEAGIYEVWGRLSSGRLKVFESLQEWCYEYGKYSRDEKGAVRKTDDHLMDATRYLIMSGLKKAVCEPAPKRDDIVYAMPGVGNLTWLGG